MLTAFDLSSVKQFVGQLRDQRNGCGNDESSFCSDLDESLACHVRVYEGLRQGVNAWAEAVFSGREPFNPDVENAFKNELKGFLGDAKPMAKYGRSVVTECYRLDRLEALEEAVADVGYLIQHWVSPRISIAPSGRVTIASEVAKHIASRANEMPQLPAGWLPSDPKKANIFKGSK